MRVLKHTMNAPIEGFESLEVEFNIAATAAQLELAAKNGEMGAFVTGFPNWSEVALPLELVDDDGNALPEPLPFKDYMERLPIVLSTWIASAGASHAAGDYVRQVLSPKAGKR